MSKRLGKFIAPLLIAGLVAACGDNMDPDPDPMDMTPPDLSGTYSLVTLTSATTMMVPVGPPTVQGMLQIAQTSVSGSMASGTAELSITAEALGLDIMDSGTYTANHDRSWAQTGDVFAGTGTYTLANNTLTIIVTEPAVSASTSVWQRQQ